MDLEQIISFLRSSLDSPTPDTEFTLQCETLAGQPFPQSPCSNQSLALLDAFCSEEDTAKSYLLDIDELINQNNEGQFFDSSRGNWYSSNDHNPSDGLSAIESINLSTLDTDFVLQCDTLAGQPFPLSPCSNQSLALLKAFCTDEDTVKSYLLDDDEFDNHNYEGQQFLNSPKRTLDLGTIENLSPVATPISSHISTDPLTIEPLYQSKLNSSYDNLKMNFIFLVKHGYKMSLSLNTNNSEIGEPWNDNVGQKILSVYFSTLSLRSEYWPDDAKLDGFESLLMDEACAAFKGQRYLNLFALNNDRMRACPDKLISICNGIKGYRKILTSDKITLLSNMYYHLHTMDGVINYDWTIDGWDYPASDYKFDRRDIFIFNQSFHDGLNYVIETFPDRFRNDINVIILIYLIVIFNGDTTGLKCPEMIRHEQFSYIYLLRRYLRTVCESDCEASDNHYRLMVKIEHVRLLTEKTKNKFLQLLHEPLLETITKAITLGVPKRIPQMIQAPHLKT